MMIEIYFSGRTSPVFLFCTIVARGILANFQVLSDTECSGVSSYSQHVEFGGPSPCETNCNNDANCKGITVFSCFILHDFPPLDFGIGGIIIEAYLY